ncbi:hypothetical protein GCM10023318_24570 [Nocardia callitridis]|uniref:Acyl-CoA dehydrogenase n=1 Tax=Nocardia callitridis TaxID=648753 RepID=A0ABP9K9G5_9NOCA
MTRQFSSTGEFRSELRAWLADVDLAPGQNDSLDAQLAQLARVRRALFDAGWMRYGWPEAVGGLGGPAILRAVLGEEVATRDLAEPGIYSMIEVLGPTMISYARPELAAEMVPRLLDGTEQWCQGFSEPGSGSDLASLTTKAVARGDDWVISGQKVWTSLAQYASRCVLLTRTDPTLPRHEGITAFFVDMDSPGITVRPLRTMHGVDEFAEVYFDDVVVPGDRMLGHPGDGWRVAMDLLPYERSSCFWHRIAHLYTRLDRLLAEIGTPAGHVVAATPTETAHQALSYASKTAAADSNATHRTAEHRPPAVTDAPFPQRANRGETVEPPAPREPDQPKNPTADRTTPVTETASLATEPDETSTDHTTPVSQTGTLATEPDKTSTDHTTPVSQTTSLATQPDDPTADHTTPVTETGSLGSEPDDYDLGAAYLALHTLRCRSRRTQLRLAEGAQLGPDTSIDKVLLATAEQQLFDTVRDLRPGVLELDETPWRAEFLYSRAATIYGGTAEVQRNIIARRLLDLGKE